MRKAILILFISILVFLIGDLAREKKQQEAILNCYRTHVKTNMCE